MLQIDITFPDTPNAEVEFNHCTHQNYTSNCECCFRPFKADDENVFCHNAGPGNHHAKHNKCINSWTKTIDNFLVPRCRKCNLSYNKYDILNKEKMNVQFIF